MATLNEIARSIAAKTATANNKQGTRPKFTVADVLVMSPTTLIDEARRLGGLVT